MIWYDTIRYALFVYIVYALFTVTVALNAQSRIIFVVPFFIHRAKRTFALIINTHFLFTFILHIIELIQNRIRFTLNLWITWMTSKIDAKNVLISNRARAHTANWGTAKLMFTQALRHSYVPYIITLWWEIIIIVRTRCRWCDKTMCGNVAFSKKDSIDQPLHRHTHSLVTIQNHQWTKYNLWL